MFGAKWHRRVADPVLAAFLAAPVIVDPQADRPFGAEAVLVAGLVLPLIGRRRHPEAMTAVVLAAAWLGLLTGTWPVHLPIAHLSLHVMLYTLIVRGRRRASLVAGVAAAVFFAVWSVTALSGPDAGWSVLTYDLSLATVWLLAEYVRARRAYLESIARRAELADSERRALSRAAAAEERARMRGNCTTCSRTA